MSTAVPPLAASPGDDAWRARLIASLKDCGVQRAHPNRALQWVVTLSVLAAILAVTLVGRAIINEGLRNEKQPVRIIAILLWVAFNIFVLIRIRNRFLRKAWQTSARNAEEELERAGSRRPILYLRSFQLDDRIGRPGWFERFLGTVPLETAEQGITKVLRGHGPAIAIGRPDEKLPPLGAARFYVSHDRWQQKVADVAGESHLVVWATGVTEGLRWEISHLIDNIPPEKLILWAHPHLVRMGAKEREAEWARFRAQLGGLFPKPLPETLGDARFIYFTSNWEPRPVAPPRHDFGWSIRSLFGAQRSALRAVLGVKDGAPAFSFLDRWRSRLGPIGLGTILVAILAVLASFNLPGHTISTTEGDKVISQYSSTNNPYREIRLLVDVAFIALSLSMLWGGSIVWRKVRAIGIAGLGLVSFGIAVLVVLDENKQAFRTTREGSTMMKTNIEGRDAPIPPTIMTNAREVESGVYVNLALAALVTAGAGLQLRSVWGGIVKPPAPLTEADIVYAGPRVDDSIAGLIGAAGEQIRWPRVAGFFVANVASILPTMLANSTEFSVGPVLWAVVITLAAVAAFRYIPSVAAAVVVAAAITAAATTYLITGKLDQSGLAFVSNTGFLAALAWAAPRIAPLALALWIGAMGGKVAVWAVQLAVRGSVRFGPSELWSVLLGPVLFAVCFALTVRFTPATSREKAA